MITLLARTCSGCGKPVHGRTDKKFCTDQCRNTYHNRLNSDGNNYMRNVENSLRRNRKILQMLLDTKRSIKVNRDTLQIRGFSFQYCTHILDSQSGKHYRFCYEYGYLQLQNEQVLLVHGKESCKPAIH